MTLPCPRPRALLLALLTLCALLAGCGQKGPLFIPPEPPAATDTNTDTQAST